MKLAELMIIGVETEQMHEEKAEYEESKFCIAWPEKVFQKR